MHRAQDSKHSQRVNVYASPTLLANGLSTLRFGTRCRLPYCNQFLNLHEDFDIANRSTANSVEAQLQALELDQGLRSNRLVCSMLCHQIWSQANTSRPPSARTSGISAVVLVVTRPALRSDVKRRNPPLCESKPRELPRFLLR